MNRSREFDTRKIAAISLAANIALGGTALWQHRRNRHLNGRNINLAEGLYNSEKARKLDSKTGLLDSVAFETEVKKRLADRRHPERPNVFVFADIDNFKAINDALTHAGTDKKVLLPVTKVLKDGVHRDRDLVARWGGDEFAMYLEDTSQAGAQVVCERMQAEVNAIPVSAEQNVGVTFVMVNLPQGGNYQHALNQASATLLEAKKAQEKNQIIAVDF